MKYLAFDTLSADDRTQIETALLSLVAPPLERTGLPAGYTRCSAIRSAAETTRATASSARSNCSTVATRNAS